MTSSSVLAQCWPSRYSSTYTGTFAPSFTSLVRSLRTTLPAKWRLSRSSRLVSITVWFVALEVIAESPVNGHLDALVLHAGVGVPQHEAVRRLLVIPAILEDEADPLLTLVHVPRCAVERHAHHVGHRFGAL